MKTFLRFLLKLFFRFRAFNEEALRGPGPMLLTPNHVSWFDWLFLAVCLDDNWRFVTSSFESDQLLYQQLAEAFGALRMEIEPMPLRAVANALMQQRKRNSKS